MNAIATPFLLGNSFPLSLVRRSVFIEPRSLSELKEALASRIWVSFWGHENTITAADILIDLDGITVRPASERPALYLDENNYPALDNTSFQECWVLSPDYAAGFRPSIGQEVLGDDIRGWQVLQMLWKHN
ncbi:MAG TPA: hypothetical protein VIT91_01290 [Chthoniobacterales bacterium]